MGDRLAALRAGILAFFVAALIWIWAEGESVQTRTLARVEVVLPSEASSPLVIRPQDTGWTGVVQVRLEGSVRAIEEAAGKLAQRVTLVRAPEGMPSEPGDDRIVYLREALRSLPEFQQLRGVIASVDPPQVRVRVVRMVVRDLPVRVDVSKDAPLDGDAVPAPALVRARIPEELSGLLGESAAAIAMVNEDAVARLRGDGTQNVTVPVHLPGVASDARWAGLVALAPDAVTVSLRLRRAVDSVTLPTVPVWFGLPPTEDGAKWSVEVVDKFLNDVTVTGPREEIARVKSGAAAVKGLVQLSTDELERALQNRGELTGQAVFVGMPAGVTATVANPAVRLRVTRRGETGGNGGASGN